MHKHHIIPKSRGGTDDDWNMRELRPYDHAYEHALDFVLFDHAPRFDFRHEAWPLLPEDLKEAVRDRLRQWNKDFFTGKKLSPEHCQNMSKGLKGLKRKPEVMDNIRKGQQNRRPSLTRGASVSKALTGVPRPKLECPHCGFIGGVGNMQRWHFDNCRVKLT